MATLKENMEAIKLEKDTKILPENLKSGITAFGVTGTYKGNGGSTDIPVKLFETVEEMQADETAEEGDLAVVYRSEVQNATVDSEFQTATFPDTVVLDNAITDYVEVRYRAVDSSKMFDCWGSLDSSRFMMNCYSDSGEVRIEYTSSDGITYTRTDTIGNPVDFGTEIYYEMPEMWNDAIGYFIQVGGNYFEGMFEYTVDIPLESYRLRYADISKYNLTETHSSTNIVDTNVYIGEYKFTGIDIGRKLTQIEAELDSIQQYVFNEDLSKLYAFYGVGQNIIIYNNEFYIYYPYSTRDMITYDMNSMTRTEEQVVTESVILDGYTYPLYKFPADAKWYTGSMGNNNSYLYYYLNDKRQSVTWTTCVIPEVDSTNKYLIAPTQLTLNDVSQLLPGKMAYGKTGVIEGDGSISNHIPSMIKDLFGNNETLNIKYLTVDPYNNETKKYTLCKLEEADVALALTQPGEFSSSPAIFYQNGTNKNYYFDGEYYYVAKQGTTDVLTLYQLDKQFHLIHTYTINIPNVPTGTTRKGTAITKYNDTWHLLFVNGGSTTSFSYGYGTFDLETSSYTSILSGTKAMQSTSSTSLISPWITAYGNKIGFGVVQIYKTSSSGKYNYKGHVAFVNLDSGKMTTVLDATTLVSNQSMSYTEHIVTAMNDKYLAFHITYFNTNSVNAAYNLSYNFDTAQSTKSTTVSENDDLILRNLKWIEYLGEEYAWAFNSTYAARLQLSTGKADILTLDKGPVYMDETSSYGIAPGVIYTFEGDQYTIEENPLVEEVSSGFFTKLLKTDDYIANLGIKSSKIYWYAKIEETDSYDIIATNSTTTTCIPMVPYFTAPAHKFKLDEIYFGKVEEDPIPSTGKHISELEHTDDLPLEYLNTYEVNGDGEQLTEGNIALYGNAIKSGGANNAYDIVLEGESAALSDISLSTMNEFTVEYVATWHSTSANGYPFAHGNFGNGFGIAFQDFDSSALRFFNAGNEAQINNWELEKKTVYTFVRTSDSRDISLYIDGEYLATLEPLWIDYTPLHITFNNEENYSINPINQTIHVCRVLTTALSAEEIQSRATFYINPGNPGNPDLDEPRQE